MLFKSKALFVTGATAIEVNRISSMIDDSITRRERIATSILQGFVSNSTYKFKEDEVEMYVSISLYLADTLIEQLDCNEPSSNPNS